MMEETSEHDIWRNDPRVVTLNTWINAAGARGLSQVSLMEEYCAQVTALGVPLMRAHITVNALHPVYGSVGINWQHDEGSERREHEHTSEAPTDWLQSPFYYMLSEGASTYRERLSTGGEVSRFPLLTQMAQTGATDYYAAAISFGDRDESIPFLMDEHLEGAMMSWMCHGPEGFTDLDLALIHTTFPSLCVAFRAASNRKTAEDLLGIYLGRDAGRRVLSGSIQRGSSRWIDAVICYFDLEGFTAMSQQLEGEDLIAMLNDYFGLVVARIEGQGGNVLKFMGDGLLAIFDRDTLNDAPDRAVATTQTLQAEIAALSATREKAGDPTMGYTIALHAGRVLYGNIGADERLDFTVIGPAVNLGARIGGMHKSLGQSVIISHAVVKDVTQNDCDLISLGRYMLRGVDTPQELFTMYRESPASA